MVCQLPTKPRRSDARGGIRTHTRPGLSRAARPIGAPGRGRERKPWESNPRAVSPATRFQDRPLVRPVGFRGRARGAGGRDRIGRDGPGVREGGFEPPRSCFKGRWPTVGPFPRASRESRTRLSGLEDRCLCRSASDADWMQSGRPDSNRRSPDPKSGGFPGFPTPRSRAQPGLSPSNSPARMEWRGPRLGHVDCYQDAGLSKTRDQRGSNPHLPG